MERILAIYPVEASSTSQVDQKVWIKLFFQREEMLLGLERVIDLPYCSNICVNWTNELVEAIISKLVDVMDTMDYKADELMALDDLSPENVCYVTQKLVVVTTR